MEFHVLTLFPEMITEGMNTSIMKRAIEKEQIKINAVNIRDYTLDKHKKVDDYPYGGGAGMLMQAQPVYDAHKAVCDGKKIRTVYVTPQGAVFNQKMAVEFAKEEDLIILCGHYEGIDERVITLCIDEQVSIGDYVLTGGEIPAMVLTDAVCRYIPQVLHNSNSTEDESFSENTLEYPQYTRPREFMGLSVPDVLLSGNHAEIKKWREEQKITETKKFRPDLLDN